jgi:hypothetical protein
MIPQLFEVMDLRGDRNLAHTTHDIFSKREVCGPEL